MNTFFIHIGGPKCGSSAIQSYLYRNRKKLSLSGLTYLDRRFGADLNNCTSHNATLKDLRTLDASTLKGNFSQLAHECPNNIIYSSEGLCQIKHLDTVAHQLSLASDYYDVEFLFYIRNQAELLYSGWQQWGGEWTFSEWVKRAMQKNRGNWNRIATTFQSALPNAKWHLQMFDRRLFTGGDVVTDACNILGTPYFKSHKQSNPTVPDITVLAAQQLAIKKNISVRELIQKIKRAVISESLILKSEKDNLVLSDDLRQIIQKHYFEENEKLFSAFNTPRKEVSSFYNVNVPSITNYSASDIDDHENYIITSMGSLI